MLARRDYGAMSDAELRRAREALIRALEFEEVAVVDRHIRRRSGGSSDRITRDAMRAVGAQIDAAVAAYDAAEEEIAGGAAREEEAVRTRIDDSFQCAKQRHRAEIAEVEAERARAVAAAKARPCARANELDARARSFARSENIGRAIAARNEAREERAAAERQRVRAVNATYDKLLQNLIDRQARELSVLQDNLLSSLNAICTRKEEELRRAKNKTVSVIKKNLRRVIIDGESKIRNTNERNVFASKLNNFVFVRLNANSRFSGVLKS